MPLITLSKIYSSNAGGASKCLKQIISTGLEIVPVSVAFANKDFTFATKISPLVAILQPYYSLTYK